MNRTEDGEVIINSIEEAQDVIDALVALRKMAVPVAKAHAKLRGYNAYIDEDDIRIDEYGYLEARFNISRCCEPEYASVEIRLDWLFNPTWLAETMAEIKRQEDAKAAAEEQIRLKREREKAEAERQEYIRLQAKYGII